MHKPAAEKIECQEWNDYCARDTGIHPIYKSELLRLAPVAEFDNNDRKKSVYNNMNSCKPHVHRRMPEFILFILHRNKRNRTFQDPEYKKAPDKKCHALCRVLFKGRKIIYDTSPHNTKVQRTGIFIIREDFEENNDETLKPDSMVLLFFLI